MRTRELQRLTVKELHEICEKTGFKEYSHKVTGQKIG